MADMSVCLSVMSCIVLKMAEHKILIFCMIAIAFLFPHTKFLMKGEGVFLTRTLNAGGVWKNV